MPKYTPLADQLRDAIEGCELSILAIAKETGIPQPVLHRFYVGDRDNLTLTTADKLCRWLGMRLTRPTRHQTEDKP